jgi:hypothetical protein
MRDVIRDDARVWVFLKDAAAVSRIVPPRWAELGRLYKFKGWVELVYLGRTGCMYTGKSAHRRAVRERSSSALATSKCSRLVIICATWESVDVFVRLPQ